MVDANQLTNFCEDYFTKPGYKIKQPVGLLHPTYPDTFNPCAGHAEITKLANSPKLKKPVKWITVEPIYRHLDIKDNYHLSLFEMLTYVNATKKEESSKEEIINQFLGLHKELGLDFERLHVTTFAGYRLIGKEIPSDEESRKIWTKILGENKVHPLKSTANIEFWQQEGEQAGPRCEVFYERDDSFLEIGTVVFDNHIYTKGSFKQIPNAIYGGAGGIERLEMIVNNYKSVWEVSSIKPIINILEQHSQSVGDLRFLEDEILKTSDNLKSALMLVTEGQEKTNKTRRGQRLIRIINDVKRGLERLNIKDYKALCRDVAQITQELYAGRYEFYKKINHEKLIQYLTK